MDDHEDNRARLHEIEYTQKEILKKLTSIEDRLNEAEKLTKGVLGLYTTLKVIGSIAGVIGALVVLYNQYRG